MKKHVIQVSSYYPPHIGGQENAVCSLAWQLAKVGHKVHVLTSAEGNESGVSRESGLVEVRRLPGFVFGHAPIMPAFAQELYGIARPESIVHLHVGQAFTPEMVWLLSKIRKFKYVAQLHIDFQPSGPAGFLLPIYKQLILKRVLRSAACVAVLNEKTAKIVRGTYGYEGKLVVINNGIDEAYFALQRAVPVKKPPKVLNLLFIGRLSKQKNLPALLEALKLVDKNVRLDLIGDGEERQNIEAILSQLGLDNVTMHGPMPRAEAMQFYKTADALVMPSLYEAQPLVLLEAMAARIPVIGTTVLGVEDHIKGAGILVPPTPQGLRDGIDQYYSQYAQLPGLVAEGFRRASRLSWPNLLKTYEGLYESIAH